MTTNRHIPAPNLLDYALTAEFEMPGEEADAVRKHIAECEICRGQYVRYMNRYREFASVCDAASHLKKLNMRTAKKNLKRKTFIWSAAAVLMLALSYGITGLLINHRFDHGETGLAGFYDDYRYAQTPVAYRNGRTAESTDSRLFREAVLTLFGAKTATLGVFPGYDFEKLQKAEQLFIRAEAETTNPVLEEKIREYRDKIRLINAKKEIKK